MSLFSHTVGSWQRELARDIRALGSTVFYALVVVRILIVPDFPYVYRLVIAVAVLFLLSLFIKDSDTYVARALILGILTSAFYGDVLYSSFALVLFLGLIVSSSSLGSPTSTIVKGIFLGSISTGAGYTVSSLL